MDADAVRQFLGGADNLLASRKVASFTNGHKRGPAGGDEGSRAGAGYAGGGVDAARPGGVNKILVGPQGGSTVKDGAVALGGEAVFVGIAADGGDAAEAEVEGGGLKAGFVKEGHEEGAEAAVDVQGHATLESELRKGRDVVNDTVGEVGCGSDKKNGIPVDEP